MHSYTKSKASREREWPCLLLARCLRRRTSAEYNRNTRLRLNHRKALTAGLSSISVARWGAERNAPAVDRANRSKMLAFNSARLDERRFCYRFLRVPDIFQRPITNCCLTRTILVVGRKSFTVTR
jgi:hypothetical protein